MARTTCAAPVVGRRPCRGPRRFAFRKAFVGATVRIAAPGADLWRERESTPPEVAMVRSHERRSEVRPPAQALRVEWDSTDLLAGVRAEMAAVRERLLELAGTSAPTLRATDPMPPQRLKQLKGRITVVSGWGERALSSS